jgi:hypothetical protein
MSEVINLVTVVHDWDTLMHSCLAFRLDDGTTDNVLYPNRATALQHQLRPCCVFYFRNSPGGVSARDCQIFLNMHREAYENDRIAWTEPASPDLIVSDYGARHMRQRWN